MALSKVDFNNINVTPSASKKLKWNSSANGFEAGDVGGSMVLLSTQTASSSATISFTSGIDSTYKEYIFKFYDIHPASSSKFSFNGSVDSGSNYNVTKTTTVFNAFHYENDGNQAVNYDDDGSDIAQGTGFQSLTQYTPNTENDGCVVATLHLFDPSSTTFVKHFISTANSTHTGGGNPFTSNSFVAGYFNTTSAIDAIQFKFASGNIDSGTIKLYGVS
jgi:hypothetical protein